LSIKESTLENEYYPDDIVFHDDSLLRPYLKKHTPKNRGGNGVTQISLESNIQMAGREIILGLNIPNYPK